VLEMDPRALCKLGKPYATDLHPRPLKHFLSELKSMLYSDFFSVYLLSFFCTKVPCGVHGACTVGSGCTTCSAYECVQQSTCSPEPSLTALVLVPLCRQA
jgi:hypothetical protein